MQTSTDWRRVKAALRQAAQSVERVDELIPVLSSLVEKCGEPSRVSKMVIRIGKALLNPNCSIIAPCCPDYTHNNGRYNFRGLNGGISLLAELHINFLRGIQALIPVDVRIRLLYADHEADDPELRAATGKTKDEFDSLVRSSILETRRFVAPLGWDVLPMTEVIPTLVDDEKEIADWLATDESFGSKLRSETGARADMYSRIKLRWEWEEMLERTILTAAQYVALGRYAVENGQLVCNHTTTNLSWYLQTGAGVLHNPVSVY